VISLPYFGLHTSEIFLPCLHPHQPSLPLPVTLLPLTTSHATAVSYGPFRHPTAKMRLLVTGNETNNAFAVVGTVGAFDKPIGFHYHNEAHDVFLCLEGTLNVWANDIVHLPSRPQ
jgi:quercetin dioxygenase-like cupin family protein